MTDPQNPSALPKHVRFKPVRSLFAGFVAMMVTTACSGDKAEGPNTLDTDDVADVGQDAEETGDTGDAAALTDMSIDVERDATDSGADDVTIPPEDIPETTGADAGGRVQGTIAL